MLVFQLVSRLALNIYTIMAPFLFPNLRIFSVFYLIFLFYSLQNYLE